MNYKRMVEALKHISVCNDIDQAKSIAGQALPKARKSPRERRCTICGGLIIQPLPGTIQSKFCSQKCRKERFRQLAIQMSASMTPKVRAKISEAVKASIRAKG